MPAILRSSSISGQWIPIGITSKLPRCAAEARLSRGYQSSGVAIRRPSASVTISSVAVNSTERACKSPMSISKVLMPSFQECCTILFQVADYIADFMGRKPGIDRNIQIVKPEFGLTAARSDVDMGRFIALI
jgi:hypothetical protein